MENNLEEKVNESQILDQNTPKEKSKKVVSEKTKEALRKGREKLTEKWIKDKKVKDDLKEKYAIKKANQLIKNKLEIKKNMGVENENSDEEELIIQKPKPKKTKKIVIVSNDSDSDDNDIITKVIKKKDIKENKKMYEPELAPPPPPPPPPIQQPIKKNPTIVFF